MQRASLFLLVVSALALCARADTTDLRGAVFRPVNDGPTVKVISADELELTPSRDDPNYVCKYSRDGDSLRVVATVLGSPQAIYFKFVPEGLRRADGTILYDAVHFDAASKTAAGERHRRQPPWQLARSRYQLQDLSILTKRVRDTLLGLA